MFVEVELSRIIINEGSDQQIIVLKERDGNRSFPIVIGIVEIFAIDRRLKNVKLPRPMTHDLMEGIIAGLKGKIEKVVIDDLRNHTFYAKLHITCKGEMVEIDSRPSDAIALGVATSAPIFVAEHVLEKACKE